MLKDGVFEPRPTCARCRRPQSVCYCAALPSLETRTRVVVLQHPRERDVAIGTAHMATLCLPRAELHVGLRWDESPALARVLEDPERPAVLLYPGDDATDVLTEPPAGPVTLVVVDGTWSQAKTVVKGSALLRALPRFSFTPPAPSEYRIRREPKATYVSTIEALMHVLGALEGDPERFRALLNPFRAMVDAQVDCANRLHGARLRHPRKARPSPRVPSVFRERAHDLVCVVGEANAWPYRSRERDAIYKDEIVHWVAYRLGSGEAFERIVAPKNPLAPRTTSHVQLSEEALRAGAPLDALLEGWRAFLRPTDVLCHWGHYAAALFAGAGGRLPAQRVDLRHVARVVSKEKVGTLEEYAASIDSAEGATLASGRAGGRLARLAAIAGHFATLAARVSDEERSAASSAAV